MNTEPRPGYKNRHVDGLPDKPCYMQIIDSDGNIYLCEWEPFDESKFKMENYKPGKPTPGHGYLGTAKVIGGQHKGIGFHAWDQNDHEFIYYSLYSL